MWAEFPQTPNFGARKPHTNSPAHTKIGVAGNKPTHKRQSSFLEPRGLVYYFWDMLIKNKKPSTESKTDNYPGPLK